MSTAKKKADRDRSEQGVRELRLVVPDARSDAVRKRVAQSSARLSPEAERDAMQWIEAVSELDELNDDRE